MTQGVEAVEEAPAKVNLHLEVLGREEGSGFHFIETVFQALELSDQLEFQLRPDDSVMLEGHGEFSDRMGPAENNLVVQAARRFRAAVAETSGTPSPGVTIRLTKTIPTEAGLGGGSSDAAATLRGLNRLLGEPLGGRALLAIGAELGSDVPFFLSESERSLAWGRGDRLLPLPSLPAREVILALPVPGVSTPWAYGMLAGDREEAGWRRAPPSLCRSHAARDWKEVAAAARNDFEGVLFPQRPDLQRLKTALAAVGGEPALLSGTGAAVFGVFAGTEAADQAETVLRRLISQGRVLRTRTRT